MEKSHNGKLELKTGAEIVEECAQGSRKQIVVRIFFGNICSFLRLDFFKGNAGGNMFFFSGPARKTKVFIQKPKYRRF